ncbi:DUF6882 domain-containing protein [Hymenobacter yonginensis]|uniref:Uncharacterized protein n=1 Tax=Hymenobacter yonginensis TaxID=748197 RepID=A0ABY7PSF9_9BACT|nr:DUF6882 domain-containing protein [Hymenobacter yonginensis]WBO85840.1 hypothetical protein O9Z63_06225 [Hymenobacter yonginensis]
MNQINYPEFANDCLHDLIEKQDIFNAAYDINGYENWFYNQATGLLTFSTGDDELNFKYVEIGTFSKKSNTWKWSWDNEHTLPSVKDEAIQLKEFGAKYGYEKLTEGYFASSEEEAWEFTAIAAKLIKGIGAYRPTSEQLLIFMVLTEFVDTETAKNVKDLYVECGKHEYRRRAFVCSHLMARKKVGFEESFDTYENMELHDEDDYQAWCNECEVVRQQEDGWNEKSMEFADIRVVCEQCYFEMKEINLGYR